MDMTGKLKLREFFRDTLDKRGDSHDFSDDESLFVSGRLDSFSMMNLVVFLEQQFGLDFSDVDFDVSLVDSVDEIAALVDSKAG